MSDKALPKFEAALKASIAGHNGRCSVTIFPDGFAIVMPLAALATEAGVLDVIFGDLEKDQPRFVRPSTRDKA